VFSGRAILVSGATLGFHIVHENFQSIYGEFFTPFQKVFFGVLELRVEALLNAFICYEEILTLHRLKVPGLLRKTLHSTNPIESMFSTVRDGEDNIKRYRDSNMKQRWLAACRANNF
jgi:hypothetical protein